jgi:hypothetical protein
LTAGLNTEKKGSNQSFFCSSRGSKATADRGVSMQQIGRLTNQIKHPRSFLLLSLPYSSRQNYTSILKKKNFYFDETASET